MVLKTTANTQNPHTYAYDNAFYRLHVIALNLLKAHGQAGFTERLWESVPENTNINVVTRVLNTLIKNSDDTVREILKTTEGWLLQNHNPQKIHVALGLEVYPFATMAIMKGKLQAICQKYPQFTLLCARLVKERA